MAPMRLPALLAAALALAPALATAQVKIGVINSMTGPQAPIGENLTNGIKLAEEDLKAKGVQVQLVWEDDTGKPQVGLSAMAFALFAPETPKSVFSERMAIVFGFPSVVAMSRRIET